VSFEPQIISEASTEYCKENMEKLLEVGRKFNGIIFG
jgi:hypothetical protein